MNCLVFDSGPLISLTMSGLLGILAPLKKKSKKKFVIMQRVKEEIVDRPIQTKRFGLEALQILEKIHEGVLEVKGDQEILALGQELLATVNSLFSAEGQPLHIVDQAEMDSLAAGIHLGADAVVVDERITRYLIEDPHAIRNILEHRLHKRVEFNDVELHKLEKRLSGLTIIRSTELVARCIELGLLDSLVASELEEPRKSLLWSALWKLKLSGAAIAEHEIDEYVKLLSEVKSLRKVSSA